ncbi:MAG: hypothetical protein V1824_04065 [archaeon]
MEILNLNKKDKRVIFIPRTIEDLWTIKSIVQEADLISGSSSRRLRVNEESGESERKPIFVKLKIEKCEYSNTLDSLRFTGKIIEGKPLEIAPIGEYHTIEIKLDEKYTLEKCDLFEHEIELLKNSTKISSLVLLVIISYEEAEFFKLTDIGIKEITTIVSGKSGKRYTSDFKQEEYFEKIYEVISQQKQINLILAGSGRLKSELHNYISSKSKSYRILEVNIQNTSKNAVYELFTKDEVSKFFTNSVIYSQKKLLDIFLENLGKDNGRAVYGINEIEKYLSLGAMEFILINEDYWKNNKDKLVSIINLADNYKTKVLVVDNTFDISKNIKSFGGIIGNLRYSP